MEKSPVFDQKTKISWPLRLAFLKNPTIDSKLSYNRLLAGSCPISSAAFASSRWKQNRGYSPVCLRHVVFNRWLDDADEVKHSWFIQSMWRADSQAGFPQTSGWRRDFTVSLWSRLLLIVSFIQCSVCTRSVCVCVFAVFLHPPGLRSH